MRLAIAFLLAATPLFSTDYFVKNSGSDAANGLTDGTAWQTVAKVNGFTFSAGDTIYFNRGDSWAELLNPGQSGSAGNYITFTAYGTGALPILVADTGRAEAVTFVSGRDYLKLSFFTLQGGDSGSASALFECDGGTHNVIADCTADGQTTLADSCIAVGNDAFLTVTRCTMKQARDDGFTMHSTASALVEDSTITLNSQGINHSGTDMEMTVRNTTIRDNTSEDIANLSACVSLFDRCDIGRRASPGAWKVFDGADSATTFRYCRLDFTGGNSAITPEFNTLALTTMENCTVVGNTTGKFGVSNAAFNATNTIFSGINILCNLFAGGTFNKSYCITHNVSSGSVTSNTNGSTSDPLFTSSTDWTLTASSAAALNAGTDLSLTTDLAGRAVANPPDLGAYEFYLASVTFGAGAGTVTFGAGIGTVTFP